MAANLEMVNGVASMAYVGATPWHGSGKNVSDTDAMYDSHKFMVAASLDWTAEKRQLFRQVTVKGKDGFGVDTESVKTMPAEAWEVVRSTDGKVLADSVGARYTVLQNAEAFGWFQPWLDAKEAALHTGGALFEGSRIWALAKLNRDPMEIAAGDIVEKYVLLSHSHDGSLAVRVGFTPIRVVCSNTLAMAHSADASKLIRLKHSKKIHTNLENLRNVMNLMNQEFEATAEQYRLLQRKSINQKDLRKYVKQVFGIDQPDSVIWDVTERNKDMKELVSERQKNIMDEVIALCEAGKGNNLPSVRGTYWSAYNGVTEYLSYVNGRNEDNRLNSLWFGQNSTMNKDALKVAVEMATSA
jgi:phage/plasmid-like protein (TIGR03299 family)